MSGLTKIALPYWSWGCFNISLMPLTFGLRLVAPLCVSGSRRISVLFSLHRLTNRFSLSADNPLIFIEVTKIGFDKSRFDELLSDCFVDGAPVVEGLTDILSFSGDARLPFGFAWKTWFRQDWIKVVLIQSSFIRCVRGHFLLI